MKQSDLSRLVTSTVVGALVQKRWQGPVNFDLLAQRDETGGYIPVVIITGTGQRVRVTIESDS